MRRDSPFRKVKHLLEYAPLWAFGLLSRLLTFSQFSKLGARIGKLIGILYPHFNNLADKNIQRTFPSYTQEQRKALIKSSCENLGRTFFEYFVLDKALSDPAFQIIIDDSDVFMKYKDLGRPVIFISAHLGNWEMGVFEAYRCGFPLNAIYRTSSNPYLDAKVLNCRAPYVIDQIPRGRTAGIRCLRILKKGGYLVLLADQKNDQGMSIPFFNHPAPTVDGYVRLAQRTDAVLVPMRIIREGPSGTHFRIYMDPPLDPREFGEDVEGTLIKINQIIEGWITQTPDQWLWFHRRWDKKYYRE